MPNKGSIQRRDGGDKTLNSVDEFDGKPSLMHSIKETNEHARTNENLENYQNSKGGRKQKGV